MKRTDEERGRLLSLFDEQARSLRRLATFFLAPALLFGLLIFVPFTQQVTSRSRIETGLDSLRSLLAAKADMLARIAAVDTLAQALQMGPRLRRDLDVRRQLWQAATAAGTSGGEVARAWAAGRTDIDLRQAVPGLEARFPRNADASDCVWLDDRRWRDCYPVAAGALPCLGGRGCLVYADGRTYVEGGPSGVLDEPLAQELLDSLAVVQRAIREQIPPLLRLVERPELGLSEGYVRAREAFEGFRNGLGRREREARSEVDRLARDTTLLAADLERTDRLIHAIERSGSGFETPLGPLPLGIRELVFLYPTILGVAYLLCLAAFDRMMSLRRGYHEVGGDPDGGHAREDPAWVTLTAPLWYDPLRPPWPQAGRVLLALVPPAFMAWSYLALRSGLSAVVPASDSRFGPRGYEVFFLLTALVVGVKLVRVVASAAAYARSSPTPET